MGSISVGELKSILDECDDDWEVLMSFKHKYPISKEEGERGWIAFVNAVGQDPELKEVRLTN